MQKELQRKVEQLSAQRVSLEESVTSERSRREAREAKLK